MKLIQGYFPELNEAQIAAYNESIRLYKEWNEKINVISRKDIEHLEERHILHSLSIAKLLDFKKGASILDVGTGGGFPGIPLAIKFPETEFLLLDSIGKKIKVVDALVDGLGLKNVKTQHARAESVSGSFDFVISRAVTAFPELYAWVNKKIHPRSRHTLKNGFICLKGGDMREELADFRSRSTIFALSEFYSEEFFESKKLVHISI